MTPDPNLVVSIVAPLKNDAAILEDFLSELSAVSAEKYAYYEIILVDDASTDETALAIGNLLERYDRIRFLQLSRAFGREAAIFAGLETAVGDFVVVMLPEEDPPSLVPELVAHCRESKGIVYGISSIPRARGLLNALGARFFRWYCRRYVGVELHRDSTDFRAFSRQVVNALTQIRDRGRYLRVFAAGVGYHQTPFKYEPINRSGKSKRHYFWKDLDLALEIAVANTRHPLRFVSWLGFVMSALNALYVLYIIAVHFIKDTVAEGWTTASLQNTTMFLFLFLILAILCEYVGRTLLETQGRPIYFIAEERNSSVIMEDTLKKNILNESIDSR